MSLSKIVGIIAAVLAVVGVILYVLMGASDSDTPSQISPMLQLAYVMIAIAAIAAILFGLVGIFTSGNIKKTLITLGVLAAVVALGFGLADSSPDLIKDFSERPQPIEVAESTSKNVGAGLRIFYILAVIAIGSMVWGGAKRALSR